MGQNLTLGTASEIRDALFLRDANQFKNLAINDKAGSMFVPATYVPSTNIVHPEKLDDILKLNPNNKKLHGAADENDGEMVEKEVREVLGR